MEKISIRFFSNRKVRAVWDDDHSKWLFPVLDIVGILRGESNYQKTRNYWKHLKAKLKREGSQLGSITTKFKSIALDGKEHTTNVLDYKGIIELAKNFPGKRTNRFIEWFTYRDDTIGNKNKSKICALFNSLLHDTIEINTVSGLQQIHVNLFGGLYNFAGQAHTLNMAKGGFRFVHADIMSNTLKIIGAMTEDNFDKIIDKYVNMNFAYPFMKGVDYSYHYEQDSNITRGGK